MRKIVQKIVWKSKKIVQLEKISTDGVPCVPRFFHLCCVSVCLCVCCQTIKFDFLLIQTPNQTRLDMLPSQEGSRSPSLPTLEATPGRSETHQLCFRAPCSILWGIRPSTSIDALPHLKQDLSNDESLSGQPGAWHVRKIMFNACNHKTEKKTSYSNSKWFLEQFSFLW